MNPTAEAPETMAIHEEPVRPAVTLDFDQVYSAHLRDVWRMLFALGVPESDLADACQEVFVVVHRRLGDFDGSARITTWLYGIALRVASAFRRRSYVQRERLVEQAPDDPDPQALDDAVESRLALARVRDALATMDERKREVFVLYELHELALREVAEVVGCPLQTAYSRLMAARKWLAKQAGLEATR